MDNTTKEINWIITDPGEDQKCKIINTTTFVYSQGDIEEEINIEDYTLDEIEDIIISYGYTLKVGKQNIETLYGDDANQIIAECIFETEFLI